VTWRRDHTCIGVRHFGILGDEKLTTGEVAKSLKRDGPTVIAFSGGQVSSHIGVRDLEGSVNLCRNREILKRDFPITTGVWAIGAIVEDRCRRGRQVASEIGESGIPRRKFYAFQFREV
jgi:hypothetical protein